MNGIQKETMGVYREAEGVNASALKWFRRSPAHYKAYMAGKIPSVSSPSQVKGTMLHSLILEGRKDYVVHPNEYPTDKGTKPWNWAANYCKEWRAEQVLPCLGMEDAIAIEAAALHIFRHPLAASLLSGGTPEASIYGTHDATGLVLKGRADYFGDRYIADLKTAADATTNGFSKSAAKYDYEYQAGMYCTIADSLGMDIHSFYFVALELEPIPMVNVLLLSADDLAIAKASIAKNLLDLNDCITRNEWPGYCDDSPNLLRVPARKYTDESSELIIDGETCTA